MGAKCLLILITRAGCLPKPRKINIKPNPQISTGEISCRKTIRE